MRTRALAIAVFGQRYHRISFPGTSYSRADSGAEGYGSAIRPRARKNVISTTG